MSIKYMDRVWATRGLKGGPLLLMLAIADHANDAGECWPSQRHLAEKARLTNRQVRRVIAQLIKDGYLAVLERGLGRGKKTTYKLFPENAAPRRVERKEEKMSPHQKADISDTKKRTFSTELSGHLEPPKADISNGISSHARSESPIEPSGKNGIISSPDADWALCLSELLPTLAGVATRYLSGSRLEAAGDVDGVALYRVVVEPSAAVGVSWLAMQARPAIRRKLMTLFRRDVLVQIVVAESTQPQPQLETEPTP